MLGIEPKVVRITWSVLLTLGLFAFIYATRRTFLIFLFAIFFAYLISPLVSFVDRLANRRSRTLALSLVYILLTAAIISAIVTVGGRASQEAANFIARMPDLAKRATSLSDTPLPPWLEPFRGQALEFIQEQIANGVERFVPAFKEAVLQAVSAAGNIAFAILIPILSFFFLKDAEGLRAALLAIISREGSHDLFNGILNDVHIMLGHYIRALFFLSIAVFIAYEIFFQIAGVPYAALLASIAAILEFIPVAGPLIAAITACAVAFLSGYPHVGTMAVFFLVYRVFQDYAVQPFVMGSGVALHPILIVFGALAGEQVAGIPGMLFSVPVMATMRLIYVRSTRHRLIQPQSSQPNPVQTSI